MARGGGSHSSSPSPHPLPSPQLASEQKEPGRPPPGAVSQLGARPNFAITKDNKNK